MEVDAETSQVVKGQRISVRRMLAIHGTSVLNFLFTRFRETTVEDEEEKLRDIEVGEDWSKSVFSGPYGTRALRNSQ